MNGIGILMKKFMNASLIGFWPIAHGVMMVKINISYTRGQVIIVMTKLMYLMKR